MIIKVKDIKRLISFLLQNGKNCIKMLNVKAGVCVMKKNIFKYVFIVLFLGSLAANVYFFLIKGNNKLELPIYEVTYSKTGETDITNVVVDLNNNKYELVDTVKCKYDLCYWYDYDEPRLASAKWSYYDNNASNEGGYYIYDQKSNKTIYGPYKDISVEVNELSSKILQGVYLYSYDDKVGYFNLRGLNKMLFEVKYDYIESSRFQDFYATKNNSDLTLYSFISNKLVKITDAIDDYTFVDGITEDYAIIQKNGKYNFVYQGNIEAFVTNDNYDFLSVYEPYFTDLYFVYVKDGATYLSRTTLAKVRENNSLDIDPTYNHKISTKAEQWFIAPSETEGILYLEPDYQSDEFYVINLDENKIEKTQYDTILR